MVLKKDIYILILLLFIFACSDNIEDISLDEMDTTRSYAILGPISNGFVSIKYVDSNKTLYSVQTVPYNTNNFYTTGSFDVDLNSSIPADKWLLVTVEGGEDIDSDDDTIVTQGKKLQGKMFAYAKVEDFNCSRIIVNAITTIVYHLYTSEHNTSLSLQSYMNDFAQKLFRKSVNKDEIIDYKDILAYIPYKTSDTVFRNALFYKTLLKKNIMESILEDQNISILLLSDSDNDKLKWIDEILYGSDVDNNDTNNDGISDFEAYSLGLSATSIDTDGDSLRDVDELSIYHTNPLLSDTDEDYIPDGVEIAESTNPLVSDENGNGIEDGLDGDPFFIYQWYIKSLGTDIVNTASVSTIKGNDLDILPLYHRFIGGNEYNKTIIQVVDIGVESGHEDLDVNLNLSLNAINHTNDPTPTSQVTSSYESPIDVGHGTAVAGIIAARTNNDLGVRGIVPRAQIAGSNWLEDQTIPELQKVWYTQIDDDRIAVSNNSWGTYFFDDVAYELVLKEAVEKLRGGKGRVFVFAAGNDRENFGNANLSYLSNNPYVMAVAALNHLDKYASYSNPGSNILVSAYGGEHYYTGPTIMTTLLMGKSYYADEIPSGSKGSVTVDEDSGRNYTYAMNGTSSAAPIVSGVIALTLEACPDLSYRDIRWLIANTAIKIDENNTNWIRNSAGLWHSIDYGFGKINPLGMVEKCQSRDFVHLPPLQIVQNRLDTQNTFLPDTNTTISKSIAINENITVEWVGVTITTDHSYAGDLEIALISPLGTKTLLMLPNDERYAAYKYGFRFSSVSFLGEHSQGKWYVEITDRLPQNSGYLQSIGLEIYGH